MKKPDLQLVKGKLKKVVFATIFQKRVFGEVSPRKTVAEELSTPEAIHHIGFLRTPDSDFLDSSNMDLFRYAWYMFLDANVISTYEIKESKFYNMLYEVQKLYDHRDNPFHNFRHGMSVLHSTYYLLMMTKVGHCFDRLGFAAMLFASLMHDVDHSGMTNGYEMNSNSDLAITYNDTSVLENHHCSTAFSIIRQEKFNIFAGLDLDNFKKFRKWVIHAILSTDVKVHFSHLEKFKDKLTQQSFNPDYSVNEPDYLLLIGQLVHTADLYVPTKKVEHSARWSLLINQEFMNQNTAEKETGLPETPFYQNLDKLEVRYKSEKFFVDKIVSPLWIEMDRFTEGGLEVQLTHLKENLAYWTSELEKVEKENKP